MSAVFAIAQTVKVALAAATTKTVLQLVAPANQRVKIIGWGVFFDGISTTAQPVEVRVVRQSTAGTMSSLTPVLTSPAAETIQTSAQYNATAEPTIGNIEDMITCHPQQGYEVKFPQGKEIIVEGGGRIGIDCTAPAIVNVRAKFLFEE